MEYGIRTPLGRIPYVLQEIPCRLLIPPPPVELGESHQGGEFFFHEIAGPGARERVVQDIEVPIEHTADFVEWFLREIPIEPIWLCPLRLRDTEGERPWPLYPLEPGRDYVNIGFWSAVPTVPGLWAQGKLMVSTGEVSVRP